MITSKARLIIALSVLVTLVIPSCELQKDDPSYVGTWIFSEQITANDIIYNTTRTLTLSKTGYEELYVISRENSSTLTGIIATRGSLLLTHLNITFFLKELGSCKEDESGICTGTVTWYDEGTAYWSENIPYFEVAVKAEFKADGSSLSLTRDLNDDGDNLDTGEDIVFEKV